VLLHPPRSVLSAEPDRGARSNPDGLWYSAQYQQILLPASPSVHPRKEGTRTDAPAVSTLHLFFALASPCVVFFPQILPFVANLAHLIDIDTTPYPPLPPLLVEGEVGDDVLDREEDLNRLVDQLKARLVEIWIDAALAPAALGLTAQ
jgi:hypothetical protein